MSTSSAQIMVSKYHFPLKGTKLSGEFADFKSGQKKYKMSLGSLIVPGSEEMTPDK